MMKDMFETIARLFVDFTLKRFMGFIVFLIVVSITFLVYERYTNNFALSRIERRVVVLKSLQGIQAAGLSKNPELERIYNKVVVDFQEASVIQPITIGSIQIPAQFLQADAKWKFLAGGALCWYFTILAFRDIYRKNKNAPAALLLLPIFGAVLGSFGVLVPSYHWSLNYIVYPIFAPIITFVLIQAGLEFKKCIDEIGNKGPKAEGK